MSQHEHEHDPAETSTPNDPIAAWHSLYDANLSLWNKSVADMFQTQAFTEALRVYLDSYLATSTPFRQLMEQYMDFWLASFNLPSREELVRFTQRVLQIETRLDELVVQTDQIRQSLYQLQHAPASGSDVQSSELYGRLQSLSDQTGQIAQMIEEARQQRLAQIADIEGRMQNFENRIEQVARMLSEQATVTESSQRQAAGTQLEQRMHTLEGRIDQMMNLLHEQQAAPPVAANGHGDTGSAARLGTWMEALDHKAEELLRLLQAVRSQADTP